MVNCRFELNPQFSATEPEVIVRAASKNIDIEELITYIEQYQNQTISSKILPVKTNDQLIMLKTDAIILADIQQSTLLIYTLEGTFTTSETLIHFAKRVDNTNFIQISKHAYINLDHLLSLSDSFSGNMTATLVKNIKTDVSRKYVKSLMQHLGIK
ncbi:LytTR family DNA-binding domain-containing protein [Tetragenococcus solitarius]|uniref:LytTR family transcriptional regulator DNA-binding domain-containing protein n=1 Tax=Tetragenococcus solitarius TaxID=71453 RepID=A0ABP6KV50_9ENTE|nr:LytTR family DNA-binding domain-containing protein [Tetragenococcus solitarius]